MLKIPQLNKMFVLTKANWLELIDMVIETSDIEPLTNDEWSFLKGLKIEVIYNEILKQKLDEDLMNEPWTNRDNFMDYFQECINEVSIDLMNSNKHIYRYNPNGFDY